MELNSARDQKDWTCIRPSAAISFKDMTYVVVMSGNTLLCNSSSSRLEKVVVFFPRSLPWNLVRRGGSDGFLESRTDAQRIRVDT